MKRKRGPAPQGKKSRIKLKQTTIPEHVDDSLEEMYNLDNDEESFKGISDDDDEQEEDQEPITEPVAAEHRQNNINGTSKKDRKRGQKSAPTKEEFMELLFRSSSFQSNLFKLQVDELLSEVRVKYEKMGKVEDMLHKLKEILVNLPETSEQLVIFHFPDNFTEKSFTFLKPN